MIILIILTALTAAFWIIAAKRNNAFGWGMIAVLTGAILIAGIIAIPANRWEVGVEVIEFKAAAATVNNTRLKPGHDIERAAMAGIIIKSNQWLLVVQYHNRSLYDIWIPDEVDALVPIE